MSVISAISDFSLRIAVAATAAVALAACTDEPVTPARSSDSRLISFEIENESIASSRASNNTSGSSSSVLTLSSDTATLYLLPRVTQGISSRTGASSRGSLTTTESIASAGVYAAMQSAPESPFYMNNVVITADNEWTPVQEYLWPGDGALHITAYSPYCNSPRSEGIVELPSSDPSAEPTITFLTPSSVDDQFDLMWAEPVDASASPCTLTMHHALAAVRFEAGRKMPPCTIEAITMDGVESRGTLNIASGEWSAMTTPAVFTITPETKLAADGSSQYVAPGTPFAPDDSTFILLPQTLGEDAAITLTIDTDGTRQTFTASLSGQIWKAGTTTVYHLSASPAESKLILEITDSDGNPLTAVATPYTGGMTPFTVRSTYTSADGTQSPVSWKARFIDTDGQPTDAPRWITRYTAEGGGTTVDTLTTDLTDPVFLAMSEQTRILREEADINSSSGNNPYNLSNSTGASAVENTANTYIINAAGSYSLPLVYGNAVKNGSANEASYTSTLTTTTAHKRYALFHFINHLGNEITSPYIYLNSGCTPATASLVWEDHVGLIRNVRLSADSHSILFDVPASTLRQGNALIDVRDADGATLWSWQIWVTDYRPDRDNIGVESDGEVNYLYTRNLGCVMGGDRTQFTASQATFRITQTDAPEGTEPLTLDVTISQDGKIIDTQNCYPFYQWGRKDPMVTGSTQYYNAAHQELSTLRMPTTPLPSTHKDFIVTSILNPGKFIVGKDNDVSRLSPFYSNLWNIDQIVTTLSQLLPQNVKTIYDPSPIGAKVSVSNAFKTMTDKAQTSYGFDTASGNMVFTLTDGQQLSFMLLGYRSPSEGEEKSRDATGSSWTAIARTGTTTRYLSCTHEGTASLESNNMLYGFGLRPHME